MAKIAIIGSGVVGQATGEALSRQGHHIIFSDIDETKLSVLRQKGYKTARPEELGKECVDIFFLTVPTPTREEQGVDLSFLESALKTLGSGALRRLSNYPIVVVKSTIPPGTTKHLVIPTLENASGKKAGRDFGVAFEPEYLREKTSGEDALSPHHILIGAKDPMTSHVLAWLRFSFHVPITQVSPEAAELQKYVHNLWNATKISFFNEMRLVAEKLDIEDTDTLFATVMETAEASWNPLYGTRDFGPFDGMCLPKDTAGFLHWAEKELGLSLPLLKGVINVNKIMEEKTGRQAGVVPVSLSPTIPLTPREALIFPPEKNPAPDLSFQTE